MEWVTIDETRMRDVMSASQGQVYQGWIAQHPGKLARVAEIITDRVTAMRAAMEGNPRNEMDPDPSKVPRSIAHYCEALILGDLCLAMGAGMVEGQVEAVQRAEVYVRLMNSQGYYVTGGDGGSMPSPSYETGVERAARVLEG